MVNIGPVKILGLINAMGTLVENFPMSILDFRQGPTYTSIFAFIIDVLRACNIDEVDIMNRLLEKVYGFKTQINGGVETIYETIKNLEIDEQSQFLNSLEIGVKGIIMALLSSIFSCSAIPVIPTKYMDTGKYDMKDSQRFYIDEYGEIINIPVNILNMFGHMDINPFSDEGKLYFSTVGGDKYYQLTTRKELVTEGGYVSTAPACDEYSEISVQFGEGHRDYLAAPSYCEDEIKFRISRPVDKDINILVDYTDCDEIDRSVVLTIEAGQKESEILLITANNVRGEKETIHSISIDGQSGKHITSRGKDIYVYLSEASSREVINYWRTQDNDSLANVNWGAAADAGVETVVIEDASVSEVDVYEYTEIGDTIPNAQRMNLVPPEPTSESPEYIVVYQGLDANTLYRTDDANAFLWYTMNRSTSVPQYELNKTMWDSRRPARNEGVERSSDGEWNAWINSKPNPDGELHFDEMDIIHPILQIERQHNNLAVRFPAQRYYKPGAKEDDTPFVYDNLRMNATIYEFNLDYLESIRIFNPKVILYGMFDALLDGALTALLSIRPSFERKEFDTILSTAIKKYIEAEDAEVEDCYFKFSNEEFDAMLQEMLLARYNATRTGGEVNRATQHNIEDYLAKLDEVNFSSSAAGDTTKITKLLTEVSVTSGDEGSIEYGLNISVDKGWWRRLIWALVLPIVKAIFTPQVIMLFLINFKIMGIASLDDLFGNNQSMIISLIINKIFGLIRSIISYIKDKIAQILLEYVFEVLLPMIGEYQLLEIREKLEDWITLLAAAIMCLPRFNFRRSRPIGVIDEVDYADIIKEQTTPETEGGCEK